MCVSQSHKQTKFLCGDFICQILEKDINCPKSLLAFESERWGTSTIHLGHIPPDLDINYFANPIQKLYMPCVRLFLKNLCATWFLSLANKKKY